MSGETSENVPVSMPPRAFVYLAALEAILMSDGRLTHEAVGRHMKLKPDALRKWLARNPEVHPWAMARLAERRDHQRELLFERNFHLALRGSVPHADWCAKVGGWFVGNSPYPGDGDTPPGSSGAGPAVTVLIKGPDGTWAHQPPGRPLPPPAAVPVPASSSATSTP